MRTRRLIVPVLTSTLVASIGLWAPAPAAAQAGVPAGRPAPGDAKPVAPPTGAELFAGLDLAERVREQPGGGSRP